MGIASHLTRQHVNNLRRLIFSDMIKVCTFNVGHFIKFGNLSANAKNY
jgi:hypothetical protein